MINFYCACGQPMSVQDSFAGRAGNCPRCKQPFTVPMQSTPAGAPTPMPAPPPTAMPAPTSLPLPTNATQPHNAGVLAAAAAATPGAAGGARLEVVHGPPAVMGQVYPLIPGRAVVLGRDPGAEVTIASDRVSRRHCRFEPRPGGAYMLVDLGSANGTLVNQTRIDGRKALLGGEYIQAGDCLFRYCEQ